jgi:hypothetical protein
MLARNGFIFRIFQAITISLLLLFPRKAECQGTILDSLFTFSAGMVKTGEALEIITRRTGYNFTYDSRIIDKDRQADMNFRNTRLSVILDSIIRDPSITYSVIEKFIILSPEEGIHTLAGDSVPFTSVKYITGVVTDEVTSEPLPFATVALKNRGRGTVTNNNGEFGLKITPDMIDDTLAVSYLGYVRNELPLRQALNPGLTFLMKREFIPIQEIIIRNHIPQDIIDKAVLSIRRNYSEAPAYMTGFYREGVLKKRELQNYSEAVVKIYKSAYSGATLGDQLKILKSRKIENAKQSDTLAIRLKAGMGTCFQLDGIKNNFDFLDKKNMQDYKYRLNDIVTWEDESAYEIEFEQREDIDMPLYKGVVYINTSDYAVLDAEFELNQALLYRMKDSFISFSSRGFNTWPVSVKYSVSYRKIDGVYYLNHVRGDMIFTSKQKRKLFSSQFTVFFELAITDVDTKNVKRFDREEVAPIHSVISRTITNYDPDFWGNQDFLRPEDNLLKALRNMKVKLQEFSGDR